MGQNHHLKPIVKYWGRKIENAKKNQAVFEKSISFEGQKKDRRRQLLRLQIFKHIQDERLKKQHRQLQLLYRVILRLKDSRAIVKSHQGQKREREEQPGFQKNVQQRTCYATTPVFVDFLKD